jgi:hypothetical protein
VTAVHTNGDQKVLGVKIIFTVAIINLMFLGFEVAMNVIRTAFG